MTYHPATYSEVRYCYVCSDCGVEEEMAIEDLPMGWSVDDDAAYCVYCTAVAPIGPAGEPG